MTIRRFTPLLVALAFAAAFLLTMLNASQRGASAAPDSRAHAAAHAILDVDAVSAPSALPERMGIVEISTRVAIARVLAIEPVSSEVITAFALFMPSRPLLMLAEAWTMPALTPSSRDVVPVPVRARPGKWSPRLRC